MSTRSSLRVTGACLASLLFVDPALAGPKQGGDDGSLPGPTTVDPSAGKPIPAPANPGVQVTQEERIQQVARQSPSVVDIAPQKPIFLPPDKRYKPVDNRVRGPNLSASAGWSSQLDVAAAAGRVYVVWSEDDGGNPEILLAVSRDDGVSFDRPINLSGTPGRSVRPRVAASGDDVHVVWEDSVGGNVEVLHNGSSDGGVTFAAAPDNLSEAPGDASELDIAMSGRQAYVAWVEPSKQVRGVLVRALGQPRVQIAPAGSGAVRNPRLAATAGEVHLTFEASPLGDIDTFYARSRDGARSFALEGHSNINGKWISLRSDYGDEWNTRVVAAGPAVVLAYENNRPGTRTVRVESSPDAGDSLLQRNAAGTGWALHQGVTYANPQGPEFAAPMSPQLAFDGARAHIAYLSTQPAAHGPRRELRYWRSDLPEHALAFDADAPDLAATSDGGATVVYTSGGHVFAVRTGAGTHWRVTDRPGGSLRARVVAGQHNSFIAWESDSEGNMEIYFRAIATH